MKLILLILTGIGLVPMLGAQDAVQQISAGVPTPDMSGTAADVLFLFIGAVLVFSMHAGFAFLELGTVRKKNQVNALQKILVDWAISTVVYFLIGYPLAHYVSHFDGFLVNAGSLQSMHGLELAKFFFYLTFAACIPAIISGGIAERAKFLPIAIVNAILAGIAYPLLENALWWNPDGFIAKTIEKIGGMPFTDFAGSVVVHSFGGWLALPAIILLGARLKRYEHGAPSVSNIPFLALGSWILCVGWFGFNVVSAAEFKGISGLVAVNSLLAMVGGILASVVVSKNDPGFTHNGALAGLIAICAASAVVHPISAFIIGAVGGLIFFFMFTIETETMKIDDVLGVWPLHGIVGSWGGIAAGIFGHKSLGAAEDISFVSQLMGTVIAIVFALVTGFVLFGIIKAVMGIRLDEHSEQIGADRAVHNIEAYPEEVL